MNLLAPGALALAIVAVPIVAMYVLKMRRPSRVVPSTFLWEPVLHDMQANAPWQRLRPNLLLLLQLLALAALVLALARPYVLRAALAQGDVVAVLDASALMGATDVSPSRFAAAKARIGALIDDLSPNDEMSIVLMARHPRILIAQSADHAALHAALDRAATTVEQPDPAAALGVAAALARGGRHSNIFVYTAAGDPAVTGQRLPSQLHVISLGGNLRDLGIVSFAATRAADGTVVTLARVMNLGRRYASSDLQLDVATGSPTHLTWHNQVDLHPIALAPGGSTVVTRASLPGTIVAARAHLAADGLAADDQAWAAVPTPAPRRVLLVTPGDAFLRVALSLATGVTLSVVTPDHYTPARARGADLVVFDTWLPARWPASAILVVGPPSRARLPLGLTVGLPVSTSGLNPSSGGDPYNLLRYVDLSQVALSQVTPLNVPARANADVLLSTRSRPALVVGQSGAQRLAVLGFQLFNTDWALTLSFPIFMQNLLDWLAPSLTAPSGLYRPGDAVSLAVAGAAAQGPATLSVVDPVGQRTLVAPPFPVQPFVNTALPGLYTVEQSVAGATRRALFAVNVLPVAPAKAAGATGANGGGTPRVGKAEVPVELAPLVAALALLALTGEWWVAARRR